MRMPSADVYDQEMLYMPWGRLLDAIAERLSDELSEGASVADLMCGTGYLLWKLSLARPDLELIGFDIKLEYLEMLGKEKTGAAIALIEQDVVEFSPAGEYDCVICTGGVHHVVPERQEEFIKMLWSITKPGGVWLVAEPCLPLYRRRSKSEAIAELGCAYVKAVAQAGAPREVVAATCDIMCNDLVDEEHKLTIEELTDMIAHARIPNCCIERYWPTRQHWPVSEELGYGGDYLISTVKRK